MKAFKCDRCGKYFDAAPEAFDLIVTKSVLGEDVAAVERVELCEPCKKHMAGLHKNEYASWSNTKVHYVKGEM